jgi:hypothetical protein
LVAHAKADHAPPHEREHEHRASESGPREIVGQQRRDLGHGEDEHQVPEQLDRGGPAL